MILRTTRLPSTIAFILFFLLACNQKKDPNSNGTNSSDPSDTLAKMQPSKAKFPTLSPVYVAVKKTAIQNYFSKNWSEKSNISFLAAKNGQIIFEKYQGYANKNEGNLINSKTPIHIASVTKVITATAILELIAANKITLDQKVNTILKTFPYPKVTIKTLLNHRSGMRNYAYFTEEEGVWNRKTTLTNQALLGLLSEKNINLEFPTDTRFSYCNTNYAVLALIIEKITGLNYKQAIQKMIFEPLEMKNSYVFDIKTDRKKAVPSYKANNVEIGIDYLDGIYGDKNIYSTPQDLLKFDSARNAPNFLNATLRKQLYVGYSNEKKGTKNYGLGIRMINWESGQNFYFHNGWWHGNTSSYISLKKDNVTIIALSNKFTRMTYKFKNLSPLFGDYPFKIDDDIKDE